MALGSYLTVFQAELIAIKTRAEILEEMNLRPNNIFICTDNPASIRALVSERSVSRLVSESKAALNRLEIGHKVKIEWVPGHSGIPGNEKADGLARLGATTKLMAPEPSCGISLASVKKYLADWARREHKIGWKKVKTQMHSKRFLD